MFKRAATLLGALAMVSGLVVATAGSANAADKKPYPTCGKGGFCVWESEHDGGGSHRHRTEGNAAWPSGFVDNDIAWANNGHYEPGADHVRVYDKTSHGNRMSLCVHRGYSGTSDFNDATKAATFTGDFHRWGGECSSNDPQIP